MSEFAKNRQDCQNDLNATCGGVDGPLETSLWVQPLVFILFRLPFLLLALLSKIMLNTYKIDFLKSIPNVNPTTKK